MMTNPVVKNLINNKIFKNIDKEFLKVKFLGFCNTELNKHKNFKLTLEQQVNAINNFLLEGAVNKFIQENNENITKLLLDTVEESEIELLINSFKDEILSADLKIAEIVGTDGTGVHFNSIEFIFNNLSSNFNVFLKEIRTKYETKTKVILNKNFQINDTNDKSFIRNKITEILFSIGKKELNNTTSKIIDYYVHNVLATNNESKYVNLVMNGLKLCSKYPVYTNSQINCNIPQTYDKYKRFFKKGTKNYKIMREIFKNSL